jgi:decaprenyl-phosphate phosphoribosyltransferase
MAPTPGEKDSTMARSSAPTLVRQVDGPSGSLFGAEPVPTPQRWARCAGGVATAARPMQWIKNASVLVVPGLMLFALGFGGIVAAMTATVAFCLAASSVYLLNDTVDRNADRGHPTKRNRPIASGLISPAEALTAAGAFAAVALMLAWLVTPGVTAAISAYLLVTGAYSLWLKRIAYVDVAVLAAGFVLRVIAGAAAVHASAPPMLLAMVFTGAAFLAFGKRHAELALLGDRAAAHRATLGRYRLNSLDLIIRGAQVATVLFFGLWILMASGSPIGLGLGMVAGAGLWHALEAQHRAVRTGGGGNPTRDLLSNRAMLPGVAIAAAAVLSIGVIR